MLRVLPMTHKKKHRFIFSGKGKRRAIPRVYAGVPQFPYRVQSGCFRAPHDPPGDQSSPCVLRRKRTTQALRIRSRGNGVPARLGAGGSGPARHFFLRGGRHVIRVLPLASISTAPFFPVMMCQNKSEQRRCGSSHQTDRRDNSCSKEEENEEEEEGNTGPYPSPCLALTSSNSSFAASRQSLALRSN